MIINFSPFVLSTRRRTPRGFLSSLLHLWLSYIVSVVSDATGSSADYFYNEDNSCYVEIFPCLVITSEYSDSV
jgi:hypothetical protein